MTMESLLKEKTDYTEVEDRAVVPGFSERFNFFLDQAGVEQSNRYASGARLFGVTLNTVRNWCLNNKPPRHFVDLQDIVEQLSPNVKELYNRDSVAIVAWLLCGDHVPNPFKVIPHGFLTDLIMLINNVGEKNGIDIYHFSQNERDNIIKSVLNFTKSKYGAQPSRHIIDNNAALEEVILQIINLTNLGIL